MLRDRLLLYGQRGHFDQRIQAVKHAFIAFGPQVEKVLALHVLWRLRLAVVVQGYVLGVTFFGRGQTELENGLVAAGQVQHVTYLGQIGHVADLLHQIDGLLEQAVSFVVVILDVQRLLELFAGLRKYGVLIRVQARTHLFERLIQRVRACIVVYVAVQESGDELLE